MIKQMGADPDFHWFDLIDLDTGEPIENVRWANDKTGEYIVCLLHEDGKIHIVKDGMGNYAPATQRKKGNIQWVVKEMYKGSFATRSASVFVRSEDTMGRD